MSTARDTAVLYVCAERSPGNPGVAAERAEQEGKEFAEARNLGVVETIRDPYGEVDPQARMGWQKVRRMAVRREICTVIVRWPSAISPDHETRYTEIAALQENGVRVLFSWAPLAEGPVQ
ncbi:hypothetical protein [Streptomyces guryensis]|uniref:Resolvase, N terminal domain n=1 Tax=Streptomyces guryensis TaxID=2886947 RepID=A0A9Q3Z865_9ACTN|nr:hypothetical protein [Streptomyces guryensis]MCD9878173.1 hypothetical protein [Streptomyces guryensis]